MNECNSIETATNTRSNLNLIPLSDKKNFRLAEIDKTKDYFNSEIHKKQDNE